MNTFGYEKFVDILGGGGHHKNRLYLEVILCILGSYFKVKVHNRGYLGGAKISNIFWGS